jgi:hypothetical protein
MVLLKHILNVDKFSVNSEKSLIIYFNKSVKELDNNFNTLKSFNSDIEILDIYSDEQLFWSNTTDGYGLIFNAGNINYKDFFIKKIISKNKAVYASLGDGGCKLIDDQIVWTTPERYFIYWINNDYFIYKSSDLTIKVLNNISGKLLWEYTFTENNYETLFKDIIKIGIQHILGIYNNILWIVLDNGELHGLDINTGEHMHTITYAVNDDEDKAFYNQYNITNLGRYCQLDTEGGKIFGLRFQNYYEIDLNSSSPQRIKYDMSNEMSKHNMQADFMGYEWNTDGQEIFFCDTQKGIIAIFDRIEKKITWSYKLDIPKEGIGQIKDIQYKNNRLYVLDRYSTLHIFGREAE